MSEALKNPFETMPKSITGGLLPPSRKPVGDMDAIPLSATLPAGIAPEAEVSLSHAPASEPAAMTTPSEGWNPFKLTRGKAVFLAGLGTLGGVYYALDKFVPKEPVQHALQVKTQPTEHAKPTAVTPKLSEERPISLLPVPSTTPTLSPLPLPDPTPFRTVSADVPVVVAPVVPVVPEVRPLVTPDPFPPVTPAPVVPVVVPEIKPPTVSLDPLPVVTPPVVSPTPIPVVPVVTPTPVPVVPLITPEIPPVVVPERRDLIPPVTVPVTPPAEFKPLPTPSTSTAVIPIVTGSGGNVTPTPTLVTPTPIPSLTPAPTPGVKPVPEFKALPNTVTEPKTDYDVDLHRVRSGDNYQSVSEKFYGSPKYAPALRSYNSNAELTQLKEVQVPPLNVIRRMAQSMPDAIDPVVTTGSTTPAPMEVTPTWNPQGGKPKGTADDIRFEKYKVPRAGMTMKDVAKAVYGSEKEWPRVDNRNNIRFRPDEELPIGAELIVPVERIDWK